MERKNFILISVVLAFCILFCPAIILADNSGYEAVSGYLEEYGIAQYNDGLTADAVHELRKCLIADKYNKNCGKKLEEIFSGPFKLASPTVVCRNEKIIFDASNSYGKLLNNPTCFWDFGDGTSFEGLKTSKSYNKAGIYNVKFYARDSIGGPFSEHNKIIKIVVYGPSEVDAGPDIDICCNYKSDYEVNFLADPDKTDTGGLFYFWDFGDGSTDKGRSTKHIYKQPGEYIVKVRALDKDGVRCSSPEDTLKVRLKNPVKANAGGDKVAYIGETVYFDASQSSASYDSEFTWDFGDNSAKASGRQVKHIYKKGGNYKVRLRVDDRKKTGCSISEDIINAYIKSGPTAALVRKSFICSDQEVEFDASPSWHPDGSPVSFLWDFGDGIWITGESKARYTYKQGGQYIVKVIADDNSGSPVSRSKAEIKVKVNRLPTAVITSKEYFCINELVELSGDKSSDPDKDTLKYSWDFGDGSVASGANVSHIYKKPGEYNIRLSVDDGFGCGKVYAEKVIQIVPAATLNTFQNDIKFCFLPPEEYRVSFNFEKLAYTNLKDFDCSWDFGDGSRDYGKNVTHTFKNGGKHTIEMKIDDRKGLPCSVISAKINLWLNKPPVINLAPGKGCCVNQEYSFDASGSYDPDRDDMSFFWDFGDGIVAEGAKVKHAYKKGGDYKVKLTVDDGSSFGCATSNAYNDISVNESPVAKFKVRN